MICMKALNARHCRYTAVAVWHFETENIFLRHLSLISVFSRNILSIVFFLTITSSGYSQKLFRGMVMNEESSLPIAFASVGVLGKEIGTISDSSGSFRVSLPTNIKENDTILITSVGFDNFKISVKEALMKKMFQLHPVEGMLPGVLIHNFKHQSAAGSDTANYSYYRGWYEYRTGGEIGKIMKVLHKQYKLNKVAFQVDSKCDTCWLRLRVRKIVAFEPADDLLTQSVILPVTRHSPNDGLLEFDVSDLGIILKDKKIYIGFEVINCKNTDNSLLSLCFIGAEYGDHYYRKYPTVSWYNEESYGLYLKMFFDY